MNQNCIGELAMNVEQKDFLESKQCDEEIVVLRKKPIYSFVKRGADMILSLIALVVLSPVFLIVALAIWLEDRGPVFFSQIRMTTNGKKFKMYKFRSMCVDAEEKLKELQKYNEITDGPAFKMHNDPRITKVGRFIRKTSLDELPQLLNIFLGDMSIVGPRPPLPKEVEQYTPYQRQRLGVKQGLTCYWQCSGRNNIGFEEWVELDLKYIKERGIWTDIKIILKTVLAVLKMDGAK